MISLCTLILKILTLIVTFSTTLMTTDDTYLPNRVNSLLSFVATIEDPIHPSNRMETRVRVNTILNGYVLSPSPFRSLSAS
jgi:hypothetical protein